MNAREELLQNILDRNNVLCAVIHTNNYWHDNKELIKELILKENHTPEEFNKFLLTLDFDYDNGWGEQELFGTVWFKDGCWLTRTEYDGKEWWEHHTLPEVPEQCKEENIENLENNMLIADFMGYHVIKKPIWYKSLFTTCWMSEDDLNLFSTDWNCLEEVLKKCLDTSVGMNEMDKYYDIIQSLPKKYETSESYNDIPTDLSEIYKTYEKLIEFIKWYNKNKDDEEF